MNLLFMKFRVGVVDFMKFPPRQAKPNMEGIGFCNLLRI